MVKRRFNIFLLFILQLLSVTVVAAAFVPSDKQTNSFKHHSVAVGSVINAANIDEVRLNEWFYAEPLPDSIFALMQGRSYKKGCTVPRADLRYVRVLHHDFAGRVRVGELVVNKSIAQRVISIMRELYTIGYPIEKMLLVDRFGADDEKSMRANNTSAFNYRPVAGSKTLSLHSRGLAIDLNPLYNPCVKTRRGVTVVQPSTARAYADRTKKHKYYIISGNQCVTLFKKYGFRWGGDYRTLKDYQHFEWMK